jgi:hypothetical protein
MRVDLLTGRKSRWLDLTPPDPAGVTGMLLADLTPDGRSYLYFYTRTLADLYVAEGVR